MTIINYLLNNLDQLIMIDQNIPFFKKGIDYYYINKPTKTAQFFFIGKTIINYSLPNQGNVLSYPLSDNILKFIYNYSLKPKNDYPFILRHNFKIFNNYYNIDLTKNNLIKNKIAKKDINNVFLDLNINNEHNYMVNYEDMQGELNSCDNFVSNIENKDKVLKDLITTATATTTSSSSNDSSKPININISEDITTSSSSSSNDLLIPININENINNNISNVENSTIISSSSSINNDISLTLSTNASSSSNNPLISINIDNNSNITEKLIIFRDFEDAIVEVIVRDNKIIKLEINKTRLNLSDNYPIIDNEELKLCFVNGYGIDIEKKKNFFFHMFHKMYHGITLYKSFEKSFFSLDKEFIEEVKVFTTLYDKNGSIFPKEVVQWFIKNKINNEFSNIKQMRKNLKLSLDPGYKSIIEKIPNELYYTDYYISYRYQISEEFNTVFKTNSYTIYNDTWDNLEFLILLRKFMIKYILISEESRLKK